MRQFRNFLQFLLFLGLGSVILFLVFRSQNEAYLNDCCLQSNPAWEAIADEAERASLIADCRASGFPEENYPSLLDKLIADFGRVNYFWIAMVLLAFVISNISRTFKWKMLLEPMGYRPKFLNGFLSILVGYFANLGLPRMGEVVRAGLLSKYENIPVEKVMGTIVVDRIVDVMCLGISFLIAITFESEKILGYLSENMPESGGEEGGLDWKMVALGIMVLGGVLTFIFRKQLMQTALFQKLKNIVLGFWEGIQTIRNLKNPLAFIFHSLNIWFLFFLMTWLGFQAFPPTEHLDLQAALTVFIFGTLGYVIPSPGGMGTFHALVIAALTTFYAVSNADAFSAANIIFFMVSIGFNSLLGIISLIILPMINRGGEKKG